MLHRGLQDAVEKAGKKIREAGELSKQEEKPQSEAAYGVDKTEAAAKSAAGNAYAMGRKLAQKQQRSKQIQQSENVYDPVGESISEAPNCSGLTNASQTVSVGVNLPGTSTYYAESNSINTTEIKLKAEQGKPLAGRLLKNEAAEKRIKEKQISSSLGTTDDKTVRERPMRRVKPYIKTANISSVVSDKADPSVAKIKEFWSRDIKTNEPFPKKWTEKLIKKQNKTKPKMSKVD